MDLNNPTKDNINKIIKEYSIFKKENVNLIVCNMALHYLVENKKHIENIVEFIAYWLINGGEFMFTALDSEKIKKLLTKGTWSKGPYKIEEYKNKIKVLLPCSRELREEPLINLNELDIEFNKYKIIRIETKSFSDFLSNYDKIDELDEADKEFVSLYHYCIYKKIK
jgi:hypothetical protein